MNSMRHEMMTIYLVLDMRGGFVAAFSTEEAARKYVLKQPGKFNMYDVHTSEMELA